MFWSFKKIVNAGRTLAPVSLSPFAPRAPAESHINASSTNSLWILPLFHSCNEIKLENFAVFTILFQILYVCFLRTLRLSKEPPIYDPLYEIDTPAVAYCLTILTCPVLNTYILSFNCFDRLYYRTNLSFRLTHRSIFLFHLGPAWNDNILWLL